MGIAEAARAKKLERPETTDIPVNIFYIKFTEFYFDIFSVQLSFENVLKLLRVIFDNKI